MKRTSVQKRMMMRHALNDNERVCVNAAGINPGYVDVDVQMACVSPHVPDAAQFDAWARAVLNHRNTLGAVTLRIVDEDEGRRLNEQYRQRGGATNVLSFAFDAPPEVELALHGDVVICAPVVLREASEQNKSLEAHFAHMAVHGVLHLLGFDHQTNEEAKAMEELEIAIMTALGFPNPYVFVDVP